ncbi:unnamed protein product [Cuscuta europaea]|uniref:YdbS-like PH domain-containing protein n=1 Tax=Cuscuta europaea TaxID=41803 RepID=A0A9P0ZBM8_CUSEU|nr:unnamed protein product [Cuscuta europaea]
MPQQFSIPTDEPSMAAPASASPLVSPATATFNSNPILFAITSPPFLNFQPRKPTRSITGLHVSSKPSSPIVPSTRSTQETVFFDGGSHYGDLAANLLLGFTLLWLPLSLAAILRAFNLRYRFTNQRVTVISGKTKKDRIDFSYKVIREVQVVPRFIGEWGDIIITLKDGTKVDLRSVPKFREIAKYCLSMIDQPVVLKNSVPKGF